MLKHSFLSFDNTKEYNSGQKYYLFDDYIRKYRLTFNRSLVNQNLHLKFSIFGLKTNETIKLILDNKEHILTDVPFELNFTYNKYSPELFNFEIGDEIENLLVAEIIVGFLPEEINKFLNRLILLILLGL